MTEEFECEFDEAGRLILPTGIMRQLGFGPGSRIRIDTRANGLQLRRPPTHLAKIYIEPTNRCNLQCVTCIRNSWDEPLGEMSAETYARIVDGLRTLPTPPDILFGGLGEPLSHPNIVEMVRQAKAVGSSVELITNGMLLDESMSLELVKAGLDTLWVSMDGATPESYKDVRLGAALPQVLANLADFRQVDQALWGCPGHISQAAARDHIRGDEAQHLGPSGRFSDGQPFRRPPFYGDQCPAVHARYAG